MYPFILQIGKNSAIITKSRNIILNHAYQIGQRDFDEEMEEEQFLL